LLAETLFLVPTLSKCLKLEPLCLVSFSFELLAFHRLPPRFFELFSHLITARELALVKQTRDTFPNVHIID